MAPRALFSHPLWLMLLLLLLLLGASAINALVHQTQLFARCRDWRNGTCAFARLESVTFSELDLRRQTLCRAEVSAAVKQIDWANDAGGRGQVRSFRINGVEQLAVPVSPADAYSVANYPHCDDMFNIFPPFGNGVIGAGGRHSIVGVVTDNTLEFALEVAWSGDHAARPVCSMGGVSFAAFAEINVYVQAEENAGWNKSDRSVCFGNGECLCAGNDLAPRSCSCLPGYAGPDCRDCTDAFFGDSCAKQCGPCLNGGRCDSGELGSGQCVCAVGFDPATRCASCLPGFFGAQCRPCPDCNFPHGNCEDGISGSGRCSCAVGFDLAQNCMDCMGSFFGEDCAPCRPCEGGSCNHGLLGDGKCVCPEGFDPATNCQQCMPGFYGKTCTQCRSCNSHGRCNDTAAGDGACICDEGYTRDSRCSLCDEGWDFNPTTMSCQCSPEHFGTHCLSCPICAPHGHCNSGQDGDGRCICDVGWSDSNNCVGCMGGYFGETCQPCRKCGRGRCDDGLHGTGQCNCHRGWSPATDCYDCADGFFGDECVECPRDCGHGRCASGRNGTGECICNDGWQLEGEDPCTTCSEGYIGPRCELCPGFLESETPCSGHGQCVLADSEVVCHCDVRYSGKACEIYDFPFVMVAVLGSIALSTLGLCMCTMRRLARQPRPYGGGGAHSSFLHRGGSNSFSRSEYVEISGMADLEHFVSNDSRDWLIPFEALTLQCEVGNGTSGQVFRSLFHSGGGSSVVAVKRLYSPVTGQEYFQSFFRREVGILSRLHHPNVVRFYGVSYYNRVLYIVTDFCPNSLNAVIENPALKGPLEQSFFLKIINEIVGTPSYMAPEMATMGGIQCSTKGDVYSFGILLYSTWSRSKPYGDQGMNPFQLMTAVVNGLRPVIPINCPPVLARLMRACWDTNPDLRPSFPEINLLLKDQYLLAAIDEDDFSYATPPPPPPPSEARRSSRDEMLFAPGSQQDMNYGTYHANDTDDDDNDDDDAGDASDVSVPLLQDGADGSAARR
ncbi:hypothetical protein PybrP1_011776 [[Pythium] brassicae (nom. inval.)]|nr:hypothetical protein PybrP1_011776 [[Pythium] brassicae (nom. inval.)]